MSRIRVPVIVLPARSSVEVNNCVNAVLGAEVHNAIEVLEPGLFELAGVHVILKVAVVYLGLE